MSTSEATHELVLVRDVDVSPQLIWRAWTEPALLKQWFTPAPWKTVECKIDLRPGGAFRTVMQSPEGEKFPHTGCYLEVLPTARLVWTTGLAPGYRPVAEKSEVPPFTAVLMLAPSERGTRYVARAIHADEEARQKHESMGFHEGWGAALDQLVALAKTL